MKQNRNKESCLYFCVLVPVAFLSPKLVLSLPGEFALRILVD